MQCIPKRSGPPCLLAIGKNASRVEAASAAPAGSDSGDEAQLQRVTGVPCSQHHRRDRLDLPVDRTEIGSTERAGCRMTPQEGPDHLEGASERLRRHFEHRPVCRMHRRNDPPSRSRTRRRLFLLVCERVRNRRDQLDRIALLGRQRYSRVMQSHDTSKQRWFVERACTNGRDDRHVGR